MKIAKQPANAPAAAPERAPRAARAAAPARRTEAVAVAPGLGRDSFARSVEVQRPALASDAASGMTMAAAVGGGIAGRLALGRFALGLGPASWLAASLFVGTVAIQACRWLASHVIDEIGEPDAGATDESAASKYFL